MKIILLVSLIFLFDSLDFTGPLHAKGFNSIHTPDGINTFSVGDNGLIFRSSDRGFTWSGLIHGSENFRSVYSYNNDVCFTGNNGIIFKTQKTASPIFHYYTGTSFLINVCKSTNFGNNRGNLSYNTEDGWGSDICHEDSTVILSGSYGRQIFFSSDGGENFYETNAGNNEVNGGIMALTRDFILNVSSKGVYKMSAEFIVLTSILENNNSLVPKEFELSQNYPNPFNPLTKIDFSIPHSGFVSLKVYYMIGREAAKVISGFRNAGTYEIDFDASQLSAGTYIYKLVVNNLSSYKMMILSK